LRIALYILAAFLVGSIPAAYLAGRWIKGIDLRKYGTGNVGASMVWEHVSRWAAIPAALFDVCKAAVPAWLADRLGLGQSTAAAAGMAAITGHNWSVFLDFTGGRGLACLMGVWLIIFPWGFGWLALFIVLGWLLGDSAPWVITGLGTVPFFSQAIAGPAVTAPLALGMLLITFVKRLEANKRPLPPPGPERRRVIVRRLFLDRDISNHREWIDQKPDRMADERARK
jgi:glycerol-3-phosphate acyltransferase PlsY